MTDQRERVSTDPGIGPIDAVNTATLRSVEAAVEVEPDGVSLYYEPKPLVAVSDHRTLEMQSVKLSKEIDPRKLQTELSLPRSPTPPPYDSGWPQADIVLTTSQPPAPMGRRWLVPSLLCGVPITLLLLVLARSSAQHAAEVSAASTLRVEAIVSPSPTAKAGSAPPVSPAAIRLTESAVPAVSAAPTTSAPAVRHVAAVPVVSRPAALKVYPQASSASPEPSDPSVKPKRAIY